MTVETEMLNEDSIQISDQMSIFRSIENREASRNRLCLFGKPEKDSSDALLAQQFEIDRRRFIDSWGFDVLRGEPVKKRKEKSCKKSLRLSEDKENIDLSLLRRNSIGVIESQQNYVSKRNKENKCPEFTSPKKSLKMSSEKSYLKKGRQSQMTDYWNYRKLSESSSCSDKEN